MAILSDRMLPQRLGMVEREIKEGRPKGAFSTVTPADMFYLTAEFRQKFPSDFGSVGSSKSRAGESFAAASNPGFLDAFVAGLWHAASHSGAELCP